MFDLQKAFADKITQAGHHVELVEAVGRGSERHSLYHAAYKALGECVRSVVPGNEASISKQEGK